MKTAKAIIVVAMCLLVARMASGDIPSPEPSTKGEPGTYPAAAETPRYEHYEQVCMSIPKMYLLIIIIILRTIGTLRS